MVLVLSSDPDSDPGLRSGRGLDRGSVSGEKGHALKKLGVFSISTV